MQRNIRIRFIIFFLNFLVSIYFFFILSLLKDKIKMFRIENNRPLVRILGTTVPTPTGNQQTFVQKVDTINSYTASKIVRNIGTGN